MQRPARSVADRPPGNHAKPYIYLAFRVYISFSNCLIRWRIHKKEIDNDNHQHAMWIFIISIERALQTTTGKDKRIRKAGLHRTVTMYQFWYQYLTEVPKALLHKPFQLHTSIRTTIDDQEDQS